RFAPDFVTQSSNLVKVSKPTGFDPNAATATVNGSSESRRPLETGGGGTAFADLLNGLITPDATDPTKNHGRFAISVDDGPYTNVNIAGAAYQNGQAAIATEIGARINAQLPPGAKVAVTFEQVQGTIRVLHIRSDTTDHVSVRVQPSPIEDL